MNENDVQIRMVTAIIAAYNLIHTIKRMAPGAAHAVDHEIKIINDCLDDDDCRSILANLEAQGVIPLRRDGVRYNT